MTPRTPTRRRGFTAVMAIILIALVAVALAAMSTLFATDARRTRDLSTTAQLDQLLLAGAAAAAEQARTWQDAPPSGSADVPVPPSIETGTLRLTTQPLPDQSVRVIVTASAAGQTAEQALRLKRGNAGWRVESAEILP